MPKQPETVAMAVLSRVQHPEIVSAGMCETGCAVGSAKPDLAAEWLELSLGSVYRAERLGVTIIDSFSNTCHVILRGYMGECWLWGVK